MASLLQRLFRLRRLPRDLFSVLNQIRGSVSQLQAEIADIRFAVADLDDSLGELARATRQLDRTIGIRNAEVDARFEQVTKFLIQERVDRTMARRTLDQLRGDLASLDDKLRGDLANLDDQLRGDFANLDDQVLQVREVLEQGISSVLTADVGRIVDSRG